MRFHLRDGSLEPLPALARKRQLRPQRPGGAGERNADARVATAAKRPVERRANVVALRQVDGMPVRIGHAQPVVVRALETIAKVARMAASDGVGFSGLGELFQRIGARGLEQPVTRAGIVRIGDDQRALRRVARAGRSRRIRRSPRRTRPTAAASNVKPPTKIASRRNTMRSCSESSP